MQLFSDVGPSLTFSGFIATLLSLVFSAMALWISNKRRSQTVIEELHGFTAREDERVYHPQRRDPEPVAQPAAPKERHAPPPPVAPDVHGPHYDGSETSALFGSSYPYSPTESAPQPAAKEPIGKDAFQWQ